MNLIKIACKTGRYNGAVCFQSCTGGQGVYKLCLCLWELVQPLTEAVAFFRSDPAAPASPWDPRSLALGCSMVPVPSFLASLLPSSFLHWGHHTAETRGDISSDQIILIKINRREWLSTQWELLGGTSQTRAETVCGRGSLGVGITRKRNTVWKKNQENVGHANSICFLLAALVLYAETLSWIFTCVSTCRGWLEAFRVHQGLGREGLPQVEKKMRYFFLLHPAVSKISLNSSGFLLSV